MIDCRQPTIAEAADHITRSLTPKYQLVCIQYWRDKYGDHFADQVRNEALAKTKGKKMQGMPG